MTGFGRGECIRHNRRFKVELKSVNHRFNDFTIKVPRFLNPFEDRMRHLLAKNITRGKVDMWVNFESFTPEDITVSVNEVYADAYMGALTRLGARYRLGDIPLGTAIELLAKTPDIIVFDKYESALSSEVVKDEIWATLSEAIMQAITQYNQMRETEGAALVKDIREKYDRVCEIIIEIRKRVPAAVKEHASRLRDRMGELVAKLGNKPDDSRLLTEIALLADKVDINEELTRLESHLAQLAGMLSEDEAVGRKMDFLMQEMNREANTIGSKSTDISMTQSVVELKSLIEKIREQVQNIE
jgi:uncharacterized protein (TIGR00255 family)